MRSYRLWPESKRCAVTLSFDFDANSDETRTVPRKITPQSKGRYGVDVGLRRVLDLLEDSSIPATFFIPGWVAETYPEETREIVRRGFEVGGHGYMHEKASELKPEQERMMVKRSVERLKKVTGKVPSGYRAPWWDVGPNSLKLLAGAGYKYDSSLMNRDQPYLIKPKGAASELVELPVDWALDDYPAFEIDRRSPREVREVWQADFEQLYVEGSFFNLCMHPECIGRPGRAAMLRDFVSYMKSKGDVWFASCGQVADWWRANHAAEERPNTWSNKDDSIVRT